LYTPKILSRKHQGFTLIEILTIVFILAILASIMIPNIRRSIWKARFTGCQSNLRNIATGIQVYSNDQHDHKYPESIQSLVPQYLGKIPNCPAAGMDTYSESYTFDSKTRNFTIFCKGSHHTELDMSADEPWFNLQQGLGPQ
jgi:prepilin-type N-terminal cleavage/methylation domain-containing protein